MTLEGIRMHLEFHPADAPDPNDPDVQFSVAPEQITTELLEICEQFLRQASPTVHTELRRFLAEHGHLGDLGWFLDALGFTTLNRTALNNNVGGPVTMSSERPGGLFDRVPACPPELIGPAR